MTTLVRQGLGVACIGLVAVLLGLAVSASGSGGDVGDVATLAWTLGVWITAIGIGATAYGLLRHR